MAIPALFDGEQTPEAWEKRKEDILQLFREYEYGITPDIKLDKVAYTNILELPVEDHITYEAHRAFFKKDDKFCSMRFEIYSRKSSEPLPVILMIDVFDSSPDNLEHPEVSENRESRIPYKFIVDRGMPSY